MSQDISGWAGFAWPNIVMCVAQHCLASWTPGSEGDPDCIFFTLSRTKQLLFVTFCDTTAGNVVSFDHKYGRMDKQMDGWNQMDRQTWKLKQLFRSQVYVQMVGSLGYNNFVRA